MKTATATRLTCRAPHKDPKRAPERCGGSCGSTERDLRHVLYVDAEPEPQEGVEVRPCRSCGRWNVFFARGEG